MTYQSSASLLWRGYPYVLHVLTIFYLSREESEGVLKRSWFWCSYARTYLYMDTIPIQKQFYVFGSRCHWCITFLDITSKNKMFSSAYKPPVHKLTRISLIIPSLYISVVCLKESGKGCSLFFLNYSFDSFHSFEGKFISEKCHQELDLVLCSAELSS